MEQTTTTTNQKTEDQMTPEELKDFRLKQLGITEERIKELGKIMIDGVEVLKKNDQKINTVTIINAVIPSITDAREALFIGIILGQSLAEMQNPLLGLLRSLAD